MYALTQRVSWGSMTDMLEVPGQGFKCVLAVAGTWGDMEEKYQPVHLPETLPYLKVCTFNAEQVDPEYYTLLSGLIDLIKANNLVPLFVHDRTGQARAPVVAIMAAHILDGLPWDELVSKAKALHPHIMTRISDGSVIGFARLLLGMAGCPLEILPGKRVSS